MTNDVTQQTFDTQIPSMFPHRHPLLLVDRAEITADGRAIGYKAVTRTEPWFTGHFPDRPVFPGVLMLEAMAQTGRFLTSPDRVLLDARLARIDNVRFVCPALPGDVIRMEAVMLAQFGALSKIHVEATIDGNPSARADFAVTALFEDDDQATVDSFDPVAARSVQARVLE